MENRVNCDTESFLLLDPKAIKTRDSSVVLKSNFQEAVVFVIGGANYLEYQNLMDHTKVSNILS